MKKLLVLLFCLMPTLAFAQSQRNPCYGPSANSSSCIGVTTSTPLPVVNTTANFKNITTNTNTIIKASPGQVGNVIINTAGATSAAIIYNNTTCTGAKIATVSTLVQTSISLNVNASVGICVTTSGGTPADITVTYN